MTSNLRLPMLQEHARALETCVYCPNLCRTTCPVSRQSPTEVLTPWGKMTLGFDLARSGSQVNGQEFSPVWGCTGCGACTSACRHENPVETSLYATRAEVLSRGGEMPGAAVSERNLTLRARLHELELHLAPHRTVLDAEAPRAVLLGCAYVADRELLPIILGLVRELLGPVRVLSACCGAPFLHTGHAAEAALALEDMKQKISGLEELIVVDPGCKVTLDRASAAPSRLLLDVALAASSRFEPLANDEQISYRWHDPCQLGRGLSKYEEPRRLLERITGMAPSEFSQNRGNAVCSGGGGALPRSMPEISSGIADTRILDHDSLGGGTIVTACGSSVRRFRSRGAAVLDLHQLLARALTHHG